jgi:hypothetical protein
LRGVTKDEGQAIFTQYLQGQIAAPINILMADGELKYYKVATTAPYKTAGSARRDRLVLERNISISDVPFVLNHRVDGTPTLPGAFLIMMIAEAALELRPKLKIAAFEDAAFRRFVRLKEDGPTHLRLDTRVIEEDSESTVIQVQVLSDFTHKSGMVLQKDVVQTEMLVRMMASVPSAPSGARGNTKSGKSLSDPYVMEGSPSSGPGGAGRIIVPSSGSKADRASRTSCRASWSWIRCGASGRLSWKRKIRYPCMFRKRAR